MLRPPRAEGLVRKRSTRYQVVAIALVASAMEEKDGSQAGKRGTRHHPGFRKGLLET